MDSMSEFAVSCNLRLWCKIWVDTGLIPFQPAGLDRTRLRSRNQGGNYSCPVGIFRKPTILARQYGAKGDCVVP